MRSHQQNQNLAKLAKYLLALPKDYDRFDMSLYHSGNVEVGNEEVECGTVACAIGHGPAAGIAIENIGMFGPLGTAFGWANYANVSFTQDEDELLWAFSELWKYADNTPAGVAKRIAILLTPNTEKTILAFLGCLVYVDQASWIEDYEALLRAVDLKILDKTLDNLM